MALAVHGRLASGVLTIGASNYPSGRSNFFRGDLDDIRLYDRVISDDGGA